MNKYLLLLFFFCTVNLFSQNNLGESENYPVFPECLEVTAANADTCFRSMLRKKIISDFELPPIVSEDQYQGEMTVLFEVTEDGTFETIYVDAVYPELRTELERVFRELPGVRPATYNSRPINIQFRMKLPVPMEQNDTIPVVAPEEIEDSEAFQIMEENVLEERQNLIEQDKKGRASSELNIPFSHELYSRFDDELNWIGSGFHTSTKPFLYDKVQPFYDFEQQTKALYKPVDSWFGRKLWNEHLFRVVGEDYWFTVDFALDLQLGKDLESDQDVTYNNTRAAVLQGGLGEDFNFYTVVYESQGRFANYFNRYAESIRPDGGDPAIIPGRGIAKPFMGQAYDYPVAEGYLSYSPGKFFNLQFGHGKNFIGDGYRSLLLSDSATPYPYFKLTTSFWKIQYTNTWMSLRDVRPAVTGDGSFRTKYMANHYLSYNITNRLNIGFFESVMWENDNNRGFDMNYLNPVIFYRAIEFSTGARAGNAIMGLTGKYKWSNSFNTYTQVLIDEFSSGDIFGGEGSWKNKLGFQIGAKLFDAFDVENLFFRLEYNQVRPYVYSHNTITLNYGHNNQSMAHPWGANFHELVGIVRYKYLRYYGHFKFIYGQRGYDVNTPEDNFAYGGDIYSTEENRPFDTGVEVAQGNSTNSFYTEAEAGYIINPTTNLKVYSSFIFRKFDPLIDTPHHFDNNTFWLNFGIRTDIFNWYYDY